MKTIFNSRHLPAQKLTIETLEQWCYRCENGRSSLWNSLPIKCFPLTYDLNGFKSRINRHLLTVAFF